ncbi:hypothetical protein BJX61DRAFT_545221 [Aspergillus egyptiacus]|nr:hypothetical protein BJX61DRAFT_545221 [Aspergillus egyptiacus]
MRAVPETLAGLALVLGLSQAQSNTGYDSACNPPSTGETEIEPGLFASYHCDQIYGYNEWAGTGSPAPTPADCAKECASRTDGAACAWHGDHCWFYNAGASTTTSTGAVKVTIRKDWDALKAAHDACQAELESCQADLAQCKADLNSCQTALGATNPVTPPPTGGGGVPATCDNGGTSSEFEAHGHKWKLLCGYSWAHQRVSHNLGIEQPVADLDACLQLCDSEGAQCKMVQFHSGNKGCRRWRFSNDRSHPNQGAVWNRVIKLT